MSAHRLRAVPEVQPGGRYWFDALRVRRGDLCVVGLTRKPSGVGTYRLDRITEVKRAYGRGREIVAVESGLPLVLNRPDAWDGERHWFTYSLDNAPGDIRARDLWGWWHEQGCPTWRSAAKAREAILRFVIRDEVAA